MSFRVERKSMRHSGGTKDYHLVSVTNVDNARHLLIRRWAKAGQWGNGIKIEPCSGIGTLTRAWAEAAKEKFKAGEYDRNIAENRKDYETVDELQKALGQYWPKLGEHAEWLIPGVDMGGKRAEVAAEWSESERRYTRPGATRAEDFEVPKAPEPSIEEQVKVNPQWGSW
jgi:hypothetical protein